MLLIWSYEEQEQFLQGRDARCSVNYLGVQPIRKNIAFHRVIMIATTVRKLLLLVIGTAVRLITGSDRYVNSRNPTTLRQLYTLAMSW